MTGRPVAVVGCGLVGAKRALAAAAAGLQLVAVHDADEDRAGAVAAQVPGRAPAVAPSAAAAAELAGPGGLVVVATTHDSLAPVAVDALERGCHVLVEKPGARSRDELRAVEVAATSAERTVRVGFNHRFHPAVRAARGVVASGRYGEVLLVRGRYGHGGRAGYEHEWRADRARSGGGELLDQGVHLVDLAQHLAGPVSLRYASLSTRYWPMEVEDNAFLHLGLGGGAEAWLHASWTEWKNLFSLEITCRSAKLEVSGLGGSYGAERLTTYVLGEQPGPPMTFTQEWPPGDGSWAAELVDVAAALDGRPGEGATLADAAAVLEVVQQAYRQQAAGR